MTDVSNTIIVGEWTLEDFHNDYLVIMLDRQRLDVTEQQARDLASALQVWIERGIDAKLDAHGAG